MNNPGRCLQKRRARRVMDCATLCVHRWSNCCLAQLYSTNSVLSSRSAHTHTRTNAALRMRGKGLFLDPCIVSEIAKEPLETASLSFCSEDRVWRRSASQDLALISLILQVYQRLSFKVCVLYIKADPLKIHLKKCLECFYVECYRARGTSNH